MFTSKTCEERIPYPKCENGNKVAGSVAESSCGCACPDGFSAQTRCLPCKCDELDEPVCAKDGKTYSNKCETKCAGVDVTMLQVGCIITCIAVLKTKNVTA